MTCTFPGHFTICVWRKDKPIIHTAVDDLESFLWLLSWALVHILKQYGNKHQEILDVKFALSNKEIRINVTKEYNIASWPDAVFGNLMQDWQKILTLARREVEQFTSEFSTTLASPWGDRGKPFGDPELLCKRVYEQVLESGFRHREEISRYSRWEDVIQVMTS